MHEILPQIVTQVRGAWRFRWHAVALAWGVALLGWLVVLALPDSFEARARVYVDTDSVLKPLLTGLAVDTNVMSEVNMVSTVLLSRPNLEKVVRETDLNLRAKTPEQLDRLLESLPLAIELKSGGRDNTFSIVYSDSDRAMALRVVRRLLNTFVEGSLDVKRADSSGAQRFLEEQIRDYEKRLREAEDRLATFKRENVGLMPGETGDYYTRLQTSVTSLEDLRGKYRLASGRRNELLKQLEGEEPTFGLVAGPRSGPPSPYDAKIAELQKRLDALLLAYTDRHPEVVAIRETIAQLEAQKSSSAPPPVVSAEADPARLALRALDINPVYQNMKLTLSQTDVELAELRSRIADAERTVSNLKQRVDTIPEVEAQLVRLNRDYEVNKAQHTALLQRLESARLSEEAEHSNEDVKFRIVEPATVPLKPAGPKRTLFLSAVMFLGLGCAGALAIVLNQLRPVFSSRRALGEVTGLPVIGTVSFVPLLRAERGLAREPLMLATAFGLLLLLYVLSIAFVDWLAPATRSLIG
jgi:protein tyrosine kinase modulator